MKKQLLKCLSVFTAAVLLISILGGCAKSTTTTTAPATTTTTTTTPAPTTQVITDMEGHQVTLPIKISRIATIGSVPVINGFLFALGQGDKIVNGIPASMDKPSWKYQYVIAPNIKNLPKVQNSDGTPNNEEITALNPDVVLTMDPTQAQTMENANLNVVYLSWTQPEDILKVMTLLGQIFGEQDKANNYIQYFNNTMAQVQAITNTIPDNQKVSVLYGSLSTLNIPQLISEWWIPAAGGISVSKDAHSSESITFNLESLLKWNPQVIILSTPADLQLAYSDPRFANLSAVENKQVYIIPKGVHNWGNRDIEQPLTVLWMAKTLYPDAFKNVDINAAIKDFYSKIFGYQLTDQQVSEILSGNITSF